jgi:hypothetical protein
VVVDVETVGWTEIGLIDIGSTEVVVVIKVFVLAG